MTNKAEYLLYYVAKANSQKVKQSCLFVGRRKVM